MKKIFTLIVIIALIIIIGCDSGSSKITTANIVPVEDRLQTIREKGVLTIASPNDKPFVYIDPKTNKLSGIDADIIAEIAKRLGINRIEQKEIALNEKINEMKADGTLYAILVNNGLDRNNII